MATDAKMKEVVEDIKSDLHFSPRAPLTNSGGWSTSSSPAALSAMPIVLGCARPAGITRTQNDAYAVMAGLSAIARPTDGVVELAVRLGGAEMSPACCSIAVDLEPLSRGDDIRIDPARVIEYNRARRNAATRIARIPVVSV